MSQPYVTTRSGSIQWLMQRVSAALLVLLAFGHFGLQHFTSDAVSTGLTVSARMNDAWWQAYYVIFIALALYHGINGLVGSRATYLPELDLQSKKYTNQLNDYRLTYKDARGDTHSDPATTTLREGWNLLTRQIDGDARTFFVYGDTKAPTFVLDPKTDLRVNPLGLEFGIVIRGTVLDDSFGEMHFRREFKDLRGYTIKTDASGKKYLTLEFSVNDLAGNMTQVVLNVFLDPTVPIVPGTGQRDLPPREVPVTLAELLEYYYLTGQPAPPQP